MQSKVGNRQIYVDGDQRTGVEVPPTRFEEGKPNAHDLLDSKDSRSLSNNLAAAVQYEKAEEEAEEQRRTVPDPLEPAQRHGNKPSRGAEIDAELKAEDEAILQKKGISTDS